MVTITISDSFIFERVLNGRFPEKTNAKSKKKMMKNDEKTTSSSLPLGLKITNLHRNCKNRKTKNMAPY